MDEKKPKKRYRDTLDEKSRQRYQQKIDLIGGLDPYEVSRTQLTDDATYFPAVTYIDVVNYLINTKSAYSFEELKAYKSLEAFNQVTVVGFVMYAA